MQITANQMAALEQACARSFAEKMLTHARTFAPRICEVNGDAQTLLVIERAMRNARRHGFTQQGPTTLYLELCFLFGSDFDVDPQVPWAARLLGDCDGQYQASRALRLYEQTLAYQETVAGPHDRFTRLGLRQLALLAEHPGRLEAVQSLPDFWRLALLIYPQKAAHAGEQGFAELVTAGVRQATAHGMPTREAGLLMSLLMFGFGIGCADDPLYPWIAATLRDPAIVDGAARQARLQKKAVTWLRHVVASLPGNAA